MREKRGLHLPGNFHFLSEAAIGFPNASGVIPPENGQIQEILAAEGWNTYMVGKWHLCPDAEMNLASSRRNWPIASSGWCRNGCSSAPA